MERNVRHRAYVSIETSRRAARIAVGSDSLEPSGPGMTTISRLHDDLRTSSQRVLVVEDFEPFRRFVCWMLRKNPELQVIGEVSDGMEAVRKSEALQPDLILLDIALPSLNGIEAARRIRKLAPEARIIFVSQEHSAEIAQEAFRSGALGYVVKWRAGVDLLPAIEAARENRRFVSNRA